MNNLDILFQDEDICILKPDSQRGILVIHSTKNADICNDGLYSYNELLNRKPELGLERKKSMFPGHSDIIYFRAPYNNDITSIDSLYPGFYFDENNYYILIRIDPDKTYIYNQEGRVYNNYDNYKSSRISFTDYFKIIESNKLIKPKYPISIYGNTISFRKQLLGSGSDMVGTFKKYLPTERMGEILAKIPHIPQKWFYYCGKLKNFSEIQQQKPNLQNGGKKKKANKKHKIKKTYKTKYSSQNGCKRKYSKKHIKKE